MNDSDNGPDIKSNTPPGPDVKRGPGRPPGSGKKNGATPAETPIPGSSQERGPGGRFGGKAKTANPPVDIGALAKQLQGVHQMGAMMLGLPFIQLEDKEALLLADAFAAVAREYDIALSGKTAATLQLLGTMAMIYVPRMIAIDHYVKVRKAQAKQQTEGGTSNVVDFPGGEPPRQPS